MIQLKVYETLDKLRTDQYWIDLYETEPIKLTLSIEDITNADATSTYSKSFKVPGTRKNAEFFKNAFDVDGVLYDVTTKKLAEILVDGAQFKQGHVRLQRVFFNTELDRYDYELLFLGETRDFSSIIGDAGLCELSMDDLKGGPTGIQLSINDIIDSWDAFDGTNGTPTSGLHNGDIIYPLIDHGNTYNSVGQTNEGKISLVDNHRFTQQGHALTLDRLKPMIRAKRIIDEIFNKAGYTYTSQFLNSDRFIHIYASAFGNEAEVSYDAADGGTASINKAYGNSLTATQGTNERLEWPNAWVDAGNNLSNVTTPPYGTVYTTPASGNYVINAEVWYQGSVENSDYTSTPVAASLVIRDYTTGINQAISTLGNGNGSTLQVSYSGNLIAGHDIGILVVPQFNPDSEIVTSVEFEVTEAPGIYLPSSGLECSYKQIDFIKDILTAFRLVLSPDPTDPKNFIIEPWQTYINSGNVYDWSKKLVENKDVVIEPVFFSQSNEIKFDMNPGGDYVNQYHQQAYSQNYGYLEFDSGNELLKGTRNVKLTGIAPTPVTNIEGGDEADGFVIPQLHTHSSEDAGLQHLPIKTKTRLLFYNGKKNLSTHVWYINNTSFSIYPQVSPYEEFPIAPQTLNLNWANDIQYWNDASVTTPLINGSTLYTDYWSRYISSLYNKYSRRVTAYFVLNNIDLNDFSFDDTIFVNGTYYRPEKIIDVEVGAYTEVKVQLLTANDYKPQIVLDESLTGLSAVAYGGGCGPADTAKITVTTNGTPGFTWTLSDGSTGTALQTGTPGQAPYTFVIEPVNPGATEVSIVDVLGRTGTVNVNVPLPSLPDIQAQPTITDATDCVAPCNGAASVTPTGGQAPYTIQWNDELQPGTNFSRTDLCPGQYDYIVYDANGCTSPAYLVEIDCEGPVGTPHHWVEINFDANCNESLVANHQYTIDSVSYAPGTIAELSGLSECWYLLNNDTGPVNTTVVTTGLTCQDCGGGVSPTGFYYLEDCETQEYFTAPIIDQFSQDDVVQFYKNIDPNYIRCGKIVGTSEVGPADATIYSPITYSCGDTLHCYINV